MRRLNVASRKCDCPMQIHVTRVSGGDGNNEIWVVEHRDRAMLHNHPPSRSRTAHLILRRAALTQEVHKTIAVDVETGVQPRQTMALLRHENPDLVVTVRDIYNERQRAVNDLLDGMNRTEYLPRLLDPGVYFIEYQLDEANHLSHLFFADKQAIAIYRDNPDVLVMDCTYRMNRFQMPLLNIVGVPGMNTTIHVAQVFLRREKEADFRWAAAQLMKLIAAYSIQLPQVVFTDRDLALLTSLEATFPRTPVLLCLWHIVKDVEIHARVNTFHREADPEAPRLGGTRLRDSATHRQFCDVFLRVVWASSASEYEDRRRELYRLSPTEAAYIDDTWLDIWHRRIVRYWTSSVLHFGMQATSRVDGYHATLKTWIGSTSSDILTIHTRLRHSDVASHATNLACIDV